MYFTVAVNKKKKILFTFYNYPYNFLSAWKAPAINNWKETPDKRKGRRHQSNQFSFSLLDVYKTQITQPAVSLLFIMGKLHSHSRKHSWYQHIVWDPVLAKGRIANTVCTSIYLYIHRGVLNHAESRPEASCSFIRGFGVGEGGGGRGERQR